MKSVIMLFIAVLVSFATFAQTNKNKTDTAKSTATKHAKFSCDMHPEVVSDSAGKCPKCGMNLTKMKTFVCPMHPDQTSNKAGKCPKCKMDLIELKEKEDLKKG